MIRVLKCFAFVLAVLIALDVVRGVACGLFPGVERFLMPCRAHDTVEQLEERINVLELYYYDVSGSLQLIRERVEKTEEAKVGISKTETTTQTEVGV